MRSLHFCLVLTLALSAAAQKDAKKDADPVTKVDEVVKTDAVEAEKSEAAGDKPASTRGFFGSGSHGSVGPHVAPGLVQSLNQLGAQNQFGNKPQTFPGQFGAHNQFNGAQHNQFGGGARPHNQFGGSSHNQFGGGARPHNQFGGSSHNQFGGGAPHNQFGGSPHNQFGGGAPHNQFGGGAPHNQFGGSPHNQFGGGSPHNQFGGAHNNQFGGAHAGIIPGGVPGGVPGIANPHVSPVAPPAAPATCRFWCKNPEGQAYCCEHANQAPTNVFTKPGFCPPVRPTCPLRKFSGPPSPCSNDGACDKIDKCCFDRCLDEHVCKPPHGVGR